MPASLSQKNNPAINKAMNIIARSYVLVGVPQDKAAREDAPVNNAWIGYTNEFGTTYIPARPWLHPAIKDEEEKNNARLQRGVSSALSNLSAAQSSLAASLNTVGLATVNRARAIIDAKIPPPLAQRTVEARVAKRPKLKAKYEEGKLNANDFTPLVDTGAFKKSISYVVVTNANT